MPNPSKEKSISGRGWCTELSPLKKKENHLKDSLRGNFALFEPHHMAVEYKIYKGSCCAAVPKPRKRILVCISSIDLEGGGLWEKESNNGGLGTYIAGFCALHSALSWPVIPSTREHAPPAVQRLRNQRKGHCCPHPHILRCLYHPHFSTGHSHLHWLICYKQNHHLHDQLEERFVFRFL